jgi:hypothetical protein
MAAAIEELKTMITEHYPDAQFSIERAPDEPKSIHLVPTVDIDDAGDVADLVLNRVLDFQDQGLRLHVIPIRPIERVIADLKRSGVYAQLMAEKTPGDD